LIFEMPSRFCIRRSIRGRRPPKLVHNIIFSMPPGTDPDKVFQAVRMLALNEWQLKYRYAKVLHTDDDHPHVHVVMKAVSEHGQRLNIRKATLRAWRQQLASNLRELGVAANATERAVRGETKIHRSNGAYRATELQAEGS
jgi:type IV secretory pathway VirD2 relaxase